MTQACTHCGEPVVAGPDVPASGLFCCSGCEAAHGLIQGMGLETYYRRLERDPNIRALKPEDDPATIDFSVHIRTEGTDQHALSLMVDGIHCAACVWLIETVLARDSRVTKARVNMTTRRLQLGWTGEVGAAGEILDPVRRLGYRVAPYDPRTLSDASKREEVALLKAMGVAGFAAANVMLLSVSVWAGYFQGMGPATRDLFHWVSAAIALPAVAYAGRPFFMSAFQAIRSGRVNMDVPITLGVLLATFVSLLETARSAQHAYFDSALTLLFFLLIGRFLDRRARGKARATAEHLLSLAGRAVTVLSEDGTARVVSPDQVTPGDRVLVAAGERVGVDGEVLSGRSDVDTSLITGESLPQAVASGDKVFTGTLNLSGPLTMAVTQTGENTLLAEIVRLMENAEKGRARYVALADRVAKAYSPVVHIMALATFLGWVLFMGADWRDALIISVSVLIITCPCALALAVPVVQVVAGARLMKQGILVKSATALERLRQVDGIAFDKTGTLTLGRARLVTGPEDQELRRLAAAMAGNSAHPLAKAVIQAVPGVPPAADVQEVPGRGLSMQTDAGEVRLGSRSFVGLALEDEATGPEIWLKRPGRDAVRFGFEDAPRSDAAPVVADLSDRGLALRLMSGDRAETVRQTATTVGIADWAAEMQPEQKAAFFAEKSDQGGHWLMVGDGINDAPALATAHVSMSPTTAAEVSQNAADIVFQGDRLAPVREAVEVAHKADELVRQNIMLSFLYNGITIPLAVMGYVTPLIAAIAMSSSSIMVIANAMRLNSRRVR